MTVLIAAIAGPLLALVSVIITLAVQSRVGREKRADERATARSEGQADLADAVLHSWEHQVAGLRDDVASGRTAAREEIAALRLQLEAVNADHRVQIDALKAEHRQCQEDLIVVRGRVVELEHRPIPPTGPEMADLARALTGFAEAAKTQGVAP